MGLRETLSDHTKPVAALAVVAVLGGVIFASQAFWSSDASAAAATGDGYFTVDEGKTWFTDDSAKLAPFPHNGKDALRAYLFRCGDGKPFVNHVERYKPEAKAILDSASNPNRKGPLDIQALQQANRVGREVKRPADKSWTSSGDSRAAGLVTQPKCPDATQEPVPVLP